MASSTANPGISQRATQPRIRSLESNEELIGVTIRSMVGNLEWSGPVFQTVVLLYAGINDPFNETPKKIVLGLALAHLLFIPAYIRGFSPFARGGWWMSWPVLQCLFINALLAVISREGTFGNRIVGVPGSNYSSPLWVFLAFYPWLPSRVQARALIEWLLLTSQDRRLSFHHA